MMQSLRVLLTVSMFLTLEAAGTGSGRLHANPIRKVVTLLQNMVAKVEAEGKQQGELFDKFMCYCKTGGGDLRKSIADATAKVPELESAIESAVSKKAQFEKDLEDHQADKAAAKNAMAEATAVRNKEHSEFEKESSEDKADLTATAKSITSLEGGLSSSFLQTDTERLQKMVVGREMAEDDRQALLSFFSEGAGNTGRSPGTGQIIGILKEMQDEMSGNLKEATDSETASANNYNALMRAKKKETQACIRLTEEKLQRVGQLALEIETSKNELVDTKERLRQDSKMLAGLKNECAKKEEEHKKDQKLRQEELVALSETIKVLNDDDALELFKKTLPSSSASFLQIQITDRAARNRALSMLRNRKPKSVQIDFIALALRGKKAGFEGVIKMVDGLVNTLNAEQAADDKKKVYCAAEFEKAEEKSKGLSRTISDTKSAIGKAKEDAAALEEEIKKLMVGIKELDKSVAEATKQRKDENQAYQELKANDSTAKELLNFAKNRLNKFYNPKLYNPPAERKLSREDAIYEAEGGVIPTGAPGGIAGTGIGAASFVQVQAHERSHGPSAGVIEMINVLIGDLDKELTEAGVEEKDAQADYEQAMKDAAEKRASDSKALAESESNRADLASSLEELKGTKKAARKELYATKKYIMALHSECDWLLQYFDVRKEARDNEIDSLSKAKDVLSGADYSFLQLASATRPRSFLGHP